jgi:hypothetical protein
VTGTGSQTGDLHSHLLRMRLTTGLVLATVPVAMAVAFLASYRGSSVASPMTVTLVAAAACLWLSFSANRDARERLERVKRAFAVHGDERLLFQDHWLVYLVILVRLEMMVVCGLVASLWGSGPRFGFWMMLLAGVMITLSWPTARKSQLLLGRARALRDAE